MGRKGTGKGDYVDCDKCGEHISAVYIKTHQKTPICLAAANRAAMIARNMQDVGSGSFPWRLAMHVRDNMGLPMIGEKAFTEYVKPRFGRPEKREDTYWMPTWACLLFGEEWELVRDLHDYLNTYGSLMGRAIRDLEYRKELLAAHSLGGSKAIRAYVETPADRAYRWRAQAAKLRAEADALEKKAREELGE